MIVKKETMDFLCELRDNNNREWFNERKAIFKEHQNDIKLFFMEVENRLQKTDQIESHSIFRIYRDVRFSNDKTPYKARFAGGFKRATAALRGGYFLNIEPGASIAGGGFYAPNANDLKRIRQEFEQDDSEIRAILTNKIFKNTFGGLMGSELKTAPRGFDIDHPAIDLIRKKQFYVIRNFSDKEVKDSGFIDLIIDTYQILRPYFDYMSSILTTNLNGESMID